jgi:tRNA-2-methylthio-N6-dimethylallyladenosine synthase
LRRRYYIATMGCQMNEYDSDLAGRLLVNSGLAPADNHENADLIIINTCTVRAKAQQKAFSILGRMAALKKKRRPDLILGIMGCVAQQEGAGLINRFPELDFVLGTREIGRIPQILDHIMNGREKVVSADLSQTKSFPDINDMNDNYYQGRVKGYLSIMEGCNNFCSFCIVPFVRGREVSRTSRDIIREAQYLISQGIKEITLLGQNVNSYLSREERDVDFPMLLKMLNGLDGLRRIRFTTSHPKDLSDDLIRCFEQLDKLCPHIHLPLQSGSNKILSRMNRRYTREEYLELVRKLRDVRPDLSITSDIIVGFPGETEEDFRMTLELIERIEFDGIYSFKYSDRKGTLAEKMGGKVNEGEKAVRLSKLQAIQHDITLKGNNNYLGRSQDVLVEGESRKGGQLTGRTRSNKIVNFDCNSKHLGHFVKVLIKGASTNSLQGLLLNGQ